MLKSVLFPRSLLTICIQFLIRNLLIDDCDFKKNNKYFYLPLFHRLVLKYFDIREKKIRLKEQKSNEVVDGSFSFSQEN